MEKNLRIKKNRHGYGVYAEKNFRKGEAVWIMGGKKIKISEFKFKNFKAISNLLQVGENSYISLDKISCSFNHSCNPNMGFVNNKTLVAIKNIKREEELTYDYSTTIDESFICDCRSKNCRKVVADFFSLPKKTIMKYYSKGFLPSFIKNKYKKIVKNN